jgi:hypothetical protein
LDPQDAKHLKKGSSYLQTRWSDPGQEPPGLTQWDVSLKGIPGFEKHGQDFIFARGTLRKDGLSSEGEKGN